MRIQPLAFGFIAALAFAPLALQAQSQMPDPLALPALPTLPGASAPAIPAPSVAPAAPKADTPVAPQPTTPEAPKPKAPAAAPIPEPTQSVPAASPAAKAAMPAPAPAQGMPEATKTEPAPVVATPLAAEPSSAPEKSKAKKAKKVVKPKPVEEGTVETPKKLAVEKIQAVTGANCKATARVSTQNYPGAKVIPTTNNLLKPAGKAVEADGQKIVITGRVLDTQCAPVANANVELWQNSPTGRWLLAGGEDLASAGRVFAGAGRTYTDNEGNFTFVTAFPAPLGKKAPFVNVKVSGRGIPDLSTALYFSDDTRNEQDDTYKKLVGTARGDVTIKVTQDDQENLVGNVDLVISAKAPYRTY